MLTHLIYYLGSHIKLSLLILWGIGSLLCIRPLRKFNNECAGVTKGLHWWVILLSWVLLAVFWFGIAC
jgi:hypothetical protein